MRKKDRNVREAIERCKSTKCNQHKVGSATASSYASASKSATQFLKYLLCPMIQRDELAIKVLSVPSTYENDVLPVKAFNLACTVKSKTNKE